MPPCQFTLYSFYPFTVANPQLTKRFYSLPRHHNFTTSLVEQVAQWATYASHVLPHPEDETLTFWWIGINDTGDTIGNASVRPLELAAVFPETHRRSKIPDFAAFWETEMIAYFNAVVCTIHNNEVIFWSVSRYSKWPLTMD